MQEVKYMYYNILLCQILLSLPAADQNSLKMRQFLPNIISYNNIDSVSLHSSFTEALPNPSMSYGKLLCCPARERPGGDQSRKTDVSDH